MHDPGAWQISLKQDGFFVWPGLYSTAQIEAILSELAARFAQDREGNTLRSEDGSVYGARNLLRLWPAAASFWRQPPLPALLRQALGSEFGLVRVLYFDKPPEQSWALPWHKDMTIAVRNNRLPSTHFGKPTSKAGVPHVEASRELLDSMLTVRVHLDEVTEENGPLKVLPGSHLNGKEATHTERPAQTILARPGDVLLMRPLVSHCSNKSLPGSRRHRRIVHLEFAGVAQLPDGYVWHDFLRL
jgi:hypothetical protein